jgi:DNA polymerase-3 subunit epsilon
LPNDQIDFAFVADLPTAPVVAKKRRTAAKAGAKQPAPAVPAAAPPIELANDVEALARQLEAHPDYRVLRRLQPRLAWGAAQPGTKLCRVLVLDTETTGLDQSKDKIIELALLQVDIDTDTGLPVGDVQVYDGLEDPGIPIPKEVQGITGIDDDMVRGKKLDAVRVAQLLDGVDLVIAHNAGFDRPFVEARLAQFGQLAWACSFADISWREQGRSSAKLESLALELGYFYDAHRAEMDCHALLAVLARPLPKAQQTGLAHLIAQSSQWSYRLQATNAPFDAKDKLKARAYRWNGEQKVWHTRLDDAASLSAELEWLKVNVYQQRSAMVQVEKLDARVRYSSRAGAVQLQSL